MAKFEGGNVCVTVARLLPLRLALGLSLEDLVGEPTTRGGKRYPAPKLQQQLEKLGRPPKAKQRFVCDMIDSALAQAGR